MREIYYMMLALILQNVASFDIETTESIVAPGKIQGVTDARLYVATTYASAEMINRDIPPITKRYLNAGGSFMFAQEDNRIAFRCSLYS